MRNMNKVKVAGTSLDGDRIILNNVEIDGVLSVSCRRERGKLPVVIIELVAELFYTDDDDLMDARREGLKQWENLRRNMAARGVE